MSGIGPRGGKKFSEKDISDGLMEDGRMEGQTDHYKAPQRGPN